MSSYYDSYGYNSNVDDAVAAVDSANATISNIGSLWAGSTSAAKDRKLKRELFEKQLEYNSPLNQRRRLEEAGYNPYIGHAVSTGNIDSLPDLGDHPLNSVSAGLTRSAQLAVQRLSSDTAIREAKLRNMQVRNEYARVLMQHDLFPIQRDILSQNLRALNYNNDFLSSSMMDRLDELAYRVKDSKVKYSMDKNHAAWLKYNWRDYYDELQKSVKTRNSYYEWLIKHGDALLDFQRSQADIENQHWDVINNPFGIDVGSSTLNGILNSVFQAIRLFFDFKRLP